MFPSFYPASRFLSSFQDRRGIGGGFPASSGLRHSPYAKAFTASNFLQLSSSIMAFHPHLCGHPLIHGQLGHPLGASWCPWSSSDVVPLVNLGDNFWIICILGTRTVIRHGLQALSSAFLGNVQLQNTCQGLTAKEIKPPNIQLSRVLVGNIQARTRFKQKEKEKQDQVCTFAIFAGLLYTCPAMLIANLLNKKLKPKKSNFKPSSSGVMDAKIAFKSAPGSKHKLLIFKVANTHALACISFMHILYLATCKS